MFAVVPFSSAEDGSPGWPRAAIVEAETEGKAIDDFVLACVYPHADDSVWGEAANHGSSPEHAGDHYYYICYTDLEDDEDDEVTTAHLEIMVDRVKLFETEEEAEAYRDNEFRTFEWAYDNRSEG